MQQTLNDVCKLSAYQATSALSKFLNAPIGFNIKAIEIKRVDDLKKLMNSDELVVSLNQTVKGDLSGAIFMLYQHNDACNMCDQLFLRKKGSTKSIAEVEQSALAEIANILVGNFLTTLAASLQLSSIMHLSPEFTNDTYANVYSTVLLPALNQLGDNEFVILISLDNTHITITKYVLFVTDKEKIKLILEKMMNKQ